MTSRSTQQCEVEMEFAASTPFARHLIYTAKATSRLIRKGQPSNPTCSQVLYLLASSCIEEQE